MTQQGEVKTIGFIYFISYEKVLPMTVKR